MPNGKHRREPTLRGLRFRHGSGSFGDLIATSCAVFAVATLSLGAALPVQAATVVRNDHLAAAAYASYVKRNSQSLAVSAAVTTGGIRRDQPTATSQAALNAATFAAAAVAAERAEALANLAIVPGAPVPTTGYAGPIVPASGADGPAIVAYAEQFVGVVPYIEAPTAVSPATGFECDSFVDWVFLHTTGRVLPRGVDEIAALGQVIPPASARPGDLVVYVGQHIGIYAGDGTMVDAPQAGEFVKHQTVWGTPVFVRL